MKRIFLLACLLGLICCGGAWAWMGTHIAGGGKPASAPGGGYATPTRVGTRSAYAGNVTSNWTQVSGNILIAAITGGSLTTTDCDDSVNGQYTKALDYSATGGVDGMGTTAGLSIWYKVGISAANSGTNTLTCSGISDTAVYWVEYSGVASTSPVEATTNTAHATSTSTSFDSGAGIENSTDNALYIGVYSNNAGTNTTAYTGWTKVTEQSSNCGGVYEQIVSSVATRDFSGSVGNTNAWLVGEVIFKAASL